MIIRNKPALPTRGGRSNLLCLGMLFMVLVLPPPPSGRLVVVLADDTSDTTTDGVSSNNNIGTELNGGITTRQDVSYLSDLILDIRDIDQSFASAGGANAAISIYLNGKNSDAQDLTGTKMSLSQLSSRLFHEGLTDNNTPPTYVFQLFGMSDRSTDIDKLDENLFYADSFMRSSIMASRKSTALAMNVVGVWMYATQRLYEAASKCQLRVEADNPDIIDFNDAKYYDEFIALWIGSSQIPGSSEGYSLYALAERGDELFSIGEITSSDAENNLDEDAIESLVNKRIKLLYQEGASLLSAPNVCTKDTPETPKQLWTITNRIVSQMYIPLIQLLVDALLRQDTESVQALSLALIPQISQCRPSTFKSLKDELLFLDGTPNYDRSETIIRQLQSIYPCFGLTCDDIGTLRNIPDGQKVVAIPPCVSADNDAPMAQYQPGTDVLPIARIDHDILQIRILTSLGSFFNARLLYTYGRNSPLEYYTSSSGTGNSDLGGLDGAIGFYSLKDFATSASRKNAEPYFSRFVSYHNDPNYAHNIITQTLLGDGKWGGGSTSSFEQRSAMITETSSFQVLYLHLLGQMYASVNICHGTTSTGTVRNNGEVDTDYDEEGYYKLTHPWDEVAALIIGSLEGTSVGGSSDIQDGQLIWGLSTRRGFQFQTLNKEGYPQVNSELEDLLFAGRGELDALDCTALEETVEKIRQLTLVPMFQSILRYAVQNQEHGNSEGPSQDLALGEAYALAVLPIIQSSDPEAGQIIEENMIVQSGVQPTRDGSQVVADAIGSAAISEGLKCKLLGSIPEANPCSSAYSYWRSLFLFASSAALTLFFVI